MSPRWQRKGDRRRLTLANLRAAEEFNAGVRAEVAAVGATAARPVAPAPTRAPLTVEEATAAYSAKLAEITAVDKRLGATPRRTPERHRLLDRRAALVAEARALKDLRVGLMVAEGRTPGGAIVELLRLLLDALDRLAEDGADITDDECEAMDRAAQYLERCEGGG